MNTTPKPNARPLVWLMRTIGHISASALTTILMVCLMTDSTHFLATMSFSYSIDSFRAETIESLLMLWGLGACLWAMGVILYSLASSRRKAIPYRTLKSARGTIMVETVIILPAYFVLMFGMGQFGLNMISGSMANVAGYSASRSYWVWSPEVGKNRSGTTVTQDMALDKAKIAGALVMTGATPGGNLTQGSLTDMAKSARDMTSFPGAGAGSLGGFFLSLFGGSGVGSSEVSYYKSFDDANFLTRGAGKFENAYNSIEVSAVNGGGVGVNFKYKMVQTMPIVGSLFGDMDGGRYRMTIERETKFPAQAFAPNQAMPNSSYTGSNDAESEGDGGAGGVFGF